MNMFRSAVCGLNAALILCGCSPDREKRVAAAEKGSVMEPEAAPSAAPAPTPDVLPPPVADVLPSGGSPLVPNPRPVVSRSQLLQAVEEAASSFAAGQPIPAFPSLSGRHFRLSLPFGCVGAGQRGDVSYTYDSKRGTLEIVAMPETWQDEPLVRSLIASEMTEAVEGFWIKRPWLHEEGCPAPLAQNDGAAPEFAASPDTVAIVQRHEKDDSRLRRPNERGYRATKKISPEAAPTDVGLRLLLEGRVSSEASAIRCHAVHIDSRPVCFVLVEIDRVAFESPTGELLAEWRA